METNNPNVTSVQILKQQELFGQQFSVYGTVEDPLFLAKQVAKIIKVNNVSDLVSRIDADEKVLGLTDTLGGNQQRWFLTEDGVYEILMQSRKPIAKQFKKAVKTILKEIRVVGGYIYSQPDETPEMIMARALKVAEQTLKSHAERVRELENEKQNVEFMLQLSEGENEELHKENSKLAPKAKYTEEVLQSDTTYTFTQVSKSMGLRSVYVLENMLKEKHVIYKQSGQWLPTSGYSDKPYFATRTAKYIKSDGEIGTSLSTVITERGRAFIHLLLSKVA